MLNLNIWELKIHTHTIELKDKKKIGIFYVKVYKNHNHKMINYIKFN